MPPKRVGAASEEAAISSGKTATEVRAATLGTGKAGELGREQKDSSPPLAAAGARAVSAAVHALSHMLLRSPCSITPTHTWLRKTCHRLWASSLECMHVCTLATTLPASSVAESSNSDCVVLVECLAIRRCMEQRALEWLLWGLDMSSEGGLLQSRESVLGLLLCCVC